MPAIETENSQAAGFFWCARCKHVVEPGEREVASFEDAPEGAQARLKCPRCKHWDVEWRQPATAQVRPVWRAEKLKVIQAPVSDELAKELFDRIRSELGS